MEKIFGININLDQNTLLNAALHPTDTAPTGAVSGQVYFNTSTSLLNYYDGLNWIPLASGGAGTSFGSLSNGTTEGKTFTVGSGSTFSYTGNGIINSNQFFGSGNIPVEKGGTGATGVVSGSIFFGNNSSFTQDIALFYHQPWRRMGLGSNFWSVTLPKATLHIGAATGPNCPPLIINQRATVTGSLGDYAGAVEFDGSNLYYIDGGANRRELLDISVSGVALVSKGGTGRSAFPTGSLIYYDGTNLTGIVQNRSLVIAGSGEGPFFLPPGTSGHVVTSNGTGWVSFPVPSSSIYLWTNPLSQTNQSINITNSGSFLVQAGFHDVNATILVVSGYGAGLLELDGFGRFHIANELNFGINSNPLAHPTLYAYSSSGITGGGIYIGSVNPSHAGGQIRIDASGGAGGSFIAQGLTGNAGSIDLTAKNNGAPGSIDLTSAGTNAGGSINMIGSVGGAAGSLNTNGGPNGAGGNIYTYAGSNGAGGNINLYGGSNPGSDAGSINMQGGTNSVGGSITTVGGTTTNTPGGSINTYGGTTVSARGGIINTYGASSRGGDIFTANGGGDINTTSGIIQLGTSAGRSILNKNSSITGSVNTYMPSVQGGTLIVDEAISSYGEFRIGASGRQVFLRGTTPAGSGNILLYLPHPYPDSSIATLAMTRDLPSGLLQLGLISINSVASGNYLRYNGSGWINASGETTVGGSGGVSDHGLLTGLGDDDHTQYVINSPGTSSRNLIQPTAGATTSLTVDSSSTDGADHDIFLVRDASDSELFKVWYDGLSTVDYYIDAFKNFNLRNQKELRLYQPTASGSNYVAWKAHPGMLFAQTYTLPSGAGASGMVLSNLGSNNLHWAPPLLRIALVSEGAVWADTNAPATRRFLVNTHRTIQKVDLTNYKEVRWLVNRQANAGAAGYEIRLEYNTSFSTSVAAYLDISDPPCQLIPTAANTFYETSWLPLVSGAKADVFIAMTSVSGDGVLDPNFGSIVAEFR